jgi:hypothetical protein
MTQPFTTPTPMSVDKLIPRNPDGSPKPKEQVAEEQNVRLAEQLIPQDAPGSDPTAIQ